MNNTLLKTLSGLLMALGTWLVIAPFFMEFSQAALWNSIIVGALVAFLGGVREWGNPTETSWFSWGVGILGIWLIAAPFVLSFTDLTGAFWSTFISGFLVTALAGWSIGGVHSTPVMRPQH